MELAAFIAAAARRTRFTSAHRDPLRAARIFLDSHGETAEAQALRKLIRALASRRGDFTEAEVWLFSTEALALIKALADARHEGRYHETEWLAF